MILDRKEKEIEEAREKFKEARNTCCNDREGDVGS